jgi:hypothetical protein
MSMLHYSGKEKRAPAYGCFYEYHRHGGATCQCMSATGVDEAVAKLFLDAVTPAKVEIALRAFQGLKADRDETRKQWDLQLERATYDVELARRRYEATDPANRLVAADLEARWEETLRRQEQLKRQREDFERCQPIVVSETERQRIQDLSGDLANIWDAQTTSMEDRKTLLRFLVQRVHLDGVTEKGKIRIDVQWHTGAHTTTTIDRPQVGVWAPKTSPEAVDRIRALLLKNDYATVAVKLNAEGFRTAKGLPFDDKSVGYVARTRGWNRKQDNTDKPGNH